MTRHDWLRIIAAFLVIAVLWTVGAFIAAEQTDTLKQHDTRIDRNAQQIADEQRELERVAMTTAAALCMSALLPERVSGLTPRGHDEPPRTELGLALDYAAGRPIAYESEPVCVDAVERARAQLRRRVRGTP